MPVTSDEGIDALRRLEAAMARERDVAGFFDFFFFGVLFFADCMLGGGTTSSPGSESEDPVKDPVDVNKEILNLTIWFLVILIELSNQLLA